MSAVFFKPWLGQNYSERISDKRVLILGESHYEWSTSGDLQPDLTQICIKEQLDGSWTKAFWTNIVIAFTGNTPRLEDKKRFWHSVAFYNYVQESVGFGPRVRPSAEMWKRSEAPFVKVLENLKPDAMIVLGYKLWDNLPPLNGEQGPLVPKAPPKHNDTWWFSTASSSRCLAFAIRHPSAGFNGRDWYPRIQYVLSSI